MALHESAAASNHPYTTHLNVLVPQLEMLDVPALVRAVSDQWYNQTLCQVNGSVVRLGVMQGEYHWHKHDNNDEFFFCLEGEFLVDLEARLERVRSLRASPDFAPVAAAFKRIANILGQAKGIGFTALPSGVDETLLEAGPEQELYREFRRTAGQPIENAIARLRPKVDLFFDKVLVNAPDARVRQNRLTLLHTLLAEFSSIADFSEIVTNS